MSSTLSKIVACPGTYPTVLNGQISYNDSSTAEFECLSGFYMTGTKRITCSSGVWQTAPTCNVIEQADDVFPDWWPIVAGAVLLLLVLACILCITCYFCCGHGHATFVTSYRRDHIIADGRNACGMCCRENRAETLTRDKSQVTAISQTNKKGKKEKEKKQVFDVDIPPNAHYVYIPADGDRHGTLWYAHDTHSHNPHSPTVIVGSTGQALPCSFCSPNEMQSPRGGWIPVRDTVTHKNLKDSEMVDLDVLKTRSDGDVATDRPAKLKKHAKGIKAWMPHSNPVRSINTSTK